MKNNNIKVLHYIYGTKCNQHCTFCYQKDIYEENFTFAKKFLRKYCKKLEELHIHGGEITASDNSKDFLLWTHKKNPNLKISIYTNGKEFDSWWQNFFSTSSSEVNFSLNAGTKEVYNTITQNGDFDKVIQNLEASVLLSKNNANFKITTSFFVHENNIDDFENYLKIISQFNIQKSYIFYDLTMLPEIGKLKKMIDQAEQFLISHTSHVILHLKILKEIVYSKENNTEFNCKNISSCPKASNNLYIDNKGFVYVCVHNSYPVGYLKSDSIRKILSGKRYKKIVSELQNKIFKYCEYNYCQES